MKVVIAGGSGLVGRALAIDLRDTGHEPVVLTRGRGSGTPDGIRAVIWDPTRLGPWTAELRGATAVVNLAGESVGQWPWTARRKRVLRQSRLAATRSLVYAIAALAHETRPGVLVSASGSDQYEGRDAMPATEATPPRATFLGRLCTDWEAEASRATVLGLRVVLLRMCLVVGPESPSLQVIALPIRMGLGGPIGSGHQWMSWIDLTDAVALIRLALEDDRVRGPVNAAAPDPRHQSEFGQALAATIGRPFWFRTPDWLVRLVMGEMAILALGSRRVWPAAALELGYRFRQPRLEDALERAYGRREAS